MDTIFPKTQVYWVKPVLPTTLDGMESLPLPATDKIFFPTVDGTLVVPGALYVEKLRHALAQTLRDYPHVAGRLSCNPNTKEWRIRLTNDSVPITFGSTNLPYATDEWFHNNEYHPELIDQLPMSFLSSELDDELSSQPLVRFKLTTWKKTGDTSLSFAWSHVLGDGMAIGGFMLAWSNYYQDLRPVMVPTFEKYLDPVPKIEGQFIYDTLAQVPHLGIHYSIKQIDEMFNKMHSITSRVDIRLTSAEIMAIRNKGIKNIKMRVSTMDCVVAYLVTVLNRTEDVPIHEVSSYIGWRGVESAPGNNYTPPPITSVGNNVMIVHAKLVLPDRNGTIGSIAEVMRGQINRAREPENVRRIICLSNALINTAAETGHLFWMSPYEGAVCVDNTFKVPFHDAHFGYPGSMRVYISHTRERFLRIWPANPVKISNGTWKSYTGGADINFRVKHAQRDAVLKTIEDDLKYMVATVDDGRNVAKL